MAAQETITKVKGLIDEIIAAPSCCAELKEVAKEWLEAPGEAEATKKLITELEEDVCTIDDTISFFESPTASGMFGEEKAKEILSHMKDVKAAGGAYCDCPACAAGAKILALKGELA